MTFIEFIGFIITMVAFFLLVVKQARDEKKRRQNPEAYEEEMEYQQEAVKDLLRSLNIEVQEDKPPVPPPPPTPVVEMLKEPSMPKVVESKIPKSMRIAKFDYGNAFRDPHSQRGIFEHEEAYIKRKEQQSRVKSLLRKPDSFKDAIILKEVLGEPKGLE